MRVQASAMSDDVTSMTVARSSVVPSIKDRRSPREAASHQQILPETNRKQNTYIKVHFVHETDFQLLTIHVVQAAYLICDFNILARCF